MLHVGDTLAKAKFHSFQFVRRENAAEVVFAHGT